MWKKLLLLIILANSILAVEEVVFYADENYQPYSYEEKGQIKGIYIDIIKAIDKNIVDFNIIFKPIPWVRGIKMIETGEAYALVSPYYRPIERPYMHYSLPLAIEDVAVFTLQGKGLNWPKDFVNKKIGINRGFLMLKEEEKKLLIIEEADSTEANILKLSKGRLDYYINNKYAILWGISNLLNKDKISPKEANKIRFVLSIRQEFAYIGYSNLYKWENKIRFEELVNKEIERMQKTGEIDNIIKKYLNQ